MRKIIIVRPNFRIGNTLISASLISTIRQRFPGAEIDYLVGDTTACLLENLPLRRVFTTSRRYIYNPLALVHLLRALRRERYDAAVDAGLGSLTSTLLTYAVGARYRIGDSRKGAACLLNVQIEREKRGHAYDDQAAFANAFGVSPHLGPLYVVSEEERAHALERLRSMGLPGDERPRPFIALFVGGHLSKRWPGERWVALLQQLAPAGAPVVLFTGPEELDVVEQIKRLKLRNVFVVPLQSLRRLAALCAEASLVVSPDTGPMHLAAALGVPVVAVLQIERSLSYAPKGEQDRRLIQPNSADVIQTLMTHPLWPVITGQGRSGG